MEQLEMLKREVDTRLSHSSANLLRSCSRKWVHYKVENTPHDDDYNPDMQSSAVGKTFHQVLEDHNHLKPEKIVSEIERCAEENGCLPENIPMIHAMLLRYYQEHKKSGLEVVACEYQISSDETIGFVDVIVKNSKGEWWICDLKTYKSMYFVKPANLTMDYQLNLYAAFREEIAEKFSLEIKKYKGCILRVVTKPSLKQRETESYVEYVVRLKESAGCKLYDIEVPKHLMNPDEIYAAHLELHKKSIEMRKWGDRGVCNYNNCFAYNSPCAYYSRCHSGTFTELQEELS